MFLEAHFYVYNRAPIFVLIINAVLKQLNPCVDKQKKITAGEEAAERDRAEY